MVERVGWCSRQLEEALHRIVHLESRLLELCSEVRLPIAVKTAAQVKEDTLEVRLQTPGCFQAARARLQGNTAHCVYCAASCRRAILLQIVISLC